MLEDHEHLLNIIYKGIPRNPQLWLWFQALYNSLGIARVVGTKKSLSKYLSRREIGVVWRGRRYSNQAGNTKIEFSLIVCIIMLIVYMWSYLRKLIIGINFSKVWKWLFPQQIAQKTGKTLLTGDFSEFYAELQFEFDDDEKELSCL